MAETEITTSRTDRVDHSGTIIGRYKSKLKQYSAKSKTQAEQIADLQAKLDKATKAADEAPLKLENDRLKGEIRTGRHKSEFVKLAKAAGANEKALDALYQLSGWKADKDEPDAKAMGEAIDRLKTEADYAFAGDGQTTTTTTPTPAPTGRITPPVPAPGRGGRNTPAQQGITITKAMRADPKFMLDRRNKPAIQDAAKNGRIE